MDNKQRWEYFESGQLQQKVAIQLLDWAGYWTSIGLDPIEDPLQKEQTRKAIFMILDDRGYTVKIVSSMVISMDEIKEKTPEQITDAVVYSCVVSIMASRLEWLTGINELATAD